MSVTFLRQSHILHARGAHGVTLRFVGSYSRNTIWFSVGGGIAGGSSKDKYYGWEVGSDPTLLKPVF